MEVNRYGFEVSKSLLIQAPFSVEYMDLSFWVQIQVQIFIYLNYRITEIIMCLRRDLPVNEDSVQSPHEKD